MTLSAASTQTCAVGATVSRRTFRECIRGRALVKSDLPAPCRTLPQRRPERMAIQLAFFIDVGGSIGQQRDSLSYLGHGEVLGPNRCWCGLKPHRFHDFIPAVDSTRTAEFNERLVQQLIKPGRITAHVKLMQGNFQLTQLFQKWSGGHNLSHNRVGDRQWHPTFSTRR